MGKLKDIKKVGLGLEQTLSEIKAGQIKIDAEGHGQVDVITMPPVPVEEKGFSDPTDTPTRALVDTERHVQVDVLSTANPPNLDVPLSTRATNETRDAEGHPQVDVLTTANPPNLDVPLSTRLEPGDLNLDVEKDLQVDVKTTANPPNLDVALSTRASDANLTRTDVESEVGVFSKRVDLRYDNIGLAKDRTTATNYHASRLTDGSVFIDPRNIRALTSADVITVEQPTAASLNATVVQSEKDRVITDITKVPIRKYLAPTSLAAGGSATVWTPTAGTKIRLKFISLMTDAATRLTLSFGTTDFQALEFPDKGSLLMNLIGANIEGGVDEALIVISSASATVSVTAIGDEI